MASRGRLTAKNFILKIKKAESWALIFNKELGEIELIIRNNANPVSYLGPDPKKINPGDYDSFMIDLEKCRPAENQKFWGLSNSLVKLCYVKKGQ